jgi:hypothetical protein
MSEMFNRLRGEAELASQANLMMLAERHRGSTNDLADRFSGRQLKQRLETGGLALGAGSVVALMGVAMANQAAALGTSAMLASASTALAGLGTIAIGTATLPVAPLVALGAAVTGLALHLGSKLLPVDLEKGSSFVSALTLLDKTQLTALGSRYVGVASWLKGLKQQIFVGREEKSFADFPPQQVAQLEQVQRVDSWVKYQIADLFGSDSEESRREQAAIVEGIGEAMWLNHDVEIDRDQVHAALDGSQDGETVGSVIAVDQERGLVVQDVGGGKVVLHVLKDFSESPKIGESISVVYEGGKLREEHLEHIGAETPRH